MKKYFEDKENRAELLKDLSSAVTIIYRIGLLVALFLDPSILLGVVEITESPAFKLMFL